MTGAERKFHEAGRRWDEHIHRLCVGNTTNESLIAMVNSAAELLACYAQRDKERLDYPRERARHWVAHGLCALFIASLLIELVVGK